MANSSYPEFLFMTIDEIHKYLEKTNYRYGFPGMNGRSWIRIGNIYNLVNLYYSDDFESKLKEAKMTDENIFICKGALSMKYGPN